MKKEILVSSGSAHYTVCDGKYHWDVILNPRTRRIEKRVRANWTCNNCETKETKKS